MNSKILLIGGGLTALTIYLFAKKNADRKDTKKANQVTEDLSVDTSRQALTFKELMNVNNNFNFWTVDKITIPSRICQLYNLCLSITNWSEVQNKFAVLCNNEKRLTDCLQQACSTDVFNFALDLAAKEKVITTAETAIAFYYKNQRSDKTIKKGVLIGALTDSDNLSYTFVNEYRTDGLIIKDILPVTAAIYKGNAKLVKP